MIENEKIEEMMLTLEEKAENTLTALDRDYGAIRTGRANPRILDRLEVEAYGGMSKLIELGNVSALDAKCLQINLWDKSLENTKETVGFIDTTITTAWDDVKAATKEKWDNVVETFANVKDGVFDTFTAIYDKIKGIWDSLGELFQEGFDIKLPHISVSGGVAPYGIGGQGSLPKFNIDWYANGGILTNPTIFGMQNGRFLGGGEAGAEAVLPLSNLEQMITNGMTAAMGNGGDTIVNVSIGTTALGSVILTAEQMMNLRRGK